ncbi:acyltransferase family protein [Mycobacterium sp. 1423905.2]|uniref:acyltransferase family protein n=1 Tax=Mycobacterium sp. 1423905.2 TaxID=1856859 RepID=UPI00080230F6|nr:acyltransferase family protein [Mycobacterium sp. 1423905.2]OBJ52403.1 hypothetical protein A9W95_20375 [Mycobacterium sp. 1423905.2]
MQKVQVAAPARILAVDFYRVSGVILIVLGHWTAASVTYRDGYFGRENPLVDQPWTQWLTWPFQAVPVFFLVAGYAGAVSWQHHNAFGGVTGQHWLRRRLARVLGPTAVYVGLVSAVVVVLAIMRAPGSLLEYAGWAVAMHLWFLAVYVLVVLLTPVAVAAQQRWGLLVPAVLAVVVAAVDVASLAGHLSALGWLNYLVCWGALYQLGIAWHQGGFAGRRPIVLVVGAALALTALLWPGPYPVSMIGVPGQAVQNTTPPSIAMLAFGCTQAGVAMALAPLLNRMLRSAVARRLVATANTNVMSLYLWHMLPVVIVAVVGYPAGLLPQPPEGTGQWWLARLEWVVILSVVTAVEMVLLWLLRRFFAAPLPIVEVSMSDRWTGPSLVMGAALTASALGFLAAAGFAPDGRFHWVTAIVFGGGLVLVALTGTRSAGRREESNEHPTG